MRVAFLLAGTLTLGGCGGTSKQPAKDSSLLVRLGGLGELRGVVDSWVLRLSTDPKVRERFAHTDIRRLKEHLLARLCLLAEGQCVYEGRDLFEVHEPLKIRAPELLIFLEHLSAALESTGVAASASDELIERMKQLALEGAFVTAP